MGVIRVPRLSRARYRVTFEESCSDFMCSNGVLLRLFKNMKNTKWRFFTLCGAHVNCTIMAMLYTHSIGYQPYNTMVVFKMRDSVPSAIYSPVCHVLRLWRIWLIIEWKTINLESGWSLWVWIVGCCIL